jgi:hypothetical protein
MSTDDTRTDFKPSRADRAALDGRNPGESVSTVLAAAVRRINSKVFSLPVKRQATLQPDFSARWDQLQEQLKSAKDDAERHEHIDHWSRHWLKRLGFNYGGGDGGFTYGTNNCKEQRNK